jgi:hypothetical protein
MEVESTYSAFVAENRIAAGPLVQLIPVLKDRFDRASSELVLVFDDQTGRQTDFDLRGTLPEVLARAIPSNPVRSGPGRPKLGVVSREVSLLPRHWEWLEQQPSGASAALRRLVEQEKRREPAQQRTRQAMEATGRFLTAMAGNLPGYEEATRALWAGDRNRFDQLIGNWPRDIQNHARRMLEQAGSRQEEAGGRLCESNAPAA